MSLEFATVAVIDLDKRYVLRVSMKMPRAA
jgi:hypothetical protein